MSINKILEERGQRYGDFEGHARITQDIKRAMQNSRNWAKLTDAQKEALEMVAHKIGRILNGDPDYIDSWTDIIGYTKLVEDILHSKESTTTKIDKFIEEVNRHEAISTNESLKCYETQSFNPNLRPT